MLQEHDPHCPHGVVAPPSEEIQEIWLSNELIEIVREVAHGIDERVQHVLEGKDAQGR
jgi:hypothetical protein